MPRFFDRKLFITISAVFLFQISPVKASDMFNDMFGNIQGFMVNFSDCFGMSANAVNRGRRGIPKAIIDNKQPTFRMFLGDGENFVLVSDYRYEIPNTNEIIEIPPGLVTDLASIPSAAGILNIPKLGKHSAGSIVHDFLYWDQKCTKAQADKILVEAMKEYSSSGWEVSAVKIGLAFGGDYSWEENTNLKNKGYIKILPTEALVGLPLNGSWEQYREELFQAGAKEEATLDQPSYCTALD